MSATPVYDSLRAQPRTFVDGIVAGNLTQADAYRQAYPNARNQRSITTNAARLSAMERVQAAIQERRDARASQADVTAETLLREVLAIARGDAHPNVKLRAYDQAAKLIGAYVERRETLTVNVDTKLLDDFTLDEMLAFREQRRLKLIEGESHAIESGEETGTATDPEGAREGSGEG